MKPMHREDTIRNKALSGLVALCDTETEHVSTVSRHLPDATLLVRPGFIVVAGDGSRYVDVRGLRPLAVEHGRSVLALYVRPRNLYHSFAIDAVVADGEGAFEFHRDYRLFLAADGSPWLVPAEEGPVLRIAPDGLETRARPPYADENERLTGVGRGLVHLVGAVVPRTTPVPDPDVMRGLAEEREEADLAARAAMPERMRFLFPIYEAKEYRSRLTGIDDELIVHRHGDDHLFELRPLVKIGVRGPNGAAAVLMGIADAVVGGETVVIVDRDRFLADLEKLARAAAGRKAAAVEAAIAALAERTPAQVWDHTHDSGGREPETPLYRRLVANRSRRTKVNRKIANSSDSQNGVPTPRAEILWQLMNSDFSDARRLSHAKAAWEQWARRGRPDMPTRDAS